MLPADLYFSISLICFLISLILTILFLWRCGDIGILIMTLYIINLIMQYIRTQNIIDLYILLGWVTGAILGAIIYQHKYGKPQ